MDRLARTGRRGMAVSTSRNTPRTIRSRLSFPRNRKADAAATPDSPTQQVARSASGREALGPWMGAYGSMEQGTMGNLMAEEPPSPTLFASTQGRVFADLRGAPVEAADLVPEAEAASAGAHGEVAHHPRGLVVAARDEMQAMRRKAEGQRRVPMAARMPRANNQLRRQRRVMQARKQNS